MPGPGIENLNHSGMMSQVDQAGRSSRKGCVIKQTYATVIDYSIRRVQSIVDRKRNMQCLLLLKRERQPVTPSWCCIPEAPIGLIPDAVTWICVVDTTPGPEAPQSFLTFGGGLRPIPRAAAETQEF
eukprot:749802-Hanusia_phi.AAC.1